MPEITCPLHELFDRAAEIPRADDLYLVDIRNADAGPMRTPEDIAEENGLWPVPYRGDMFDALVAAWGWALHPDDQASWRRQWGRLDGVRIGRNTYTVSAPVTLTFRWGEGHPVVDGVRMLPHEPDNKRDPERCMWCHASMAGIPRDCQRRRLLALARAEVSERGEHLAAVEKWHQVTV